MRYSEQERGCQPVRTNMNGRSDCSGHKGLSPGCVYGSFRCATGSEVLETSYLAAETVGGFSERILELELRLQTECSLPLIRALMDAYTV